MIARLALLALALFSLPAPAGAQTCPFPGGYIRGASVSVLMWQGKPAVLLMGSYDSIRLSYDAQCPPTMPAMLTPALTLAGVFAYDSRACAPTSTVNVIDDDFSPHGPGYGPLGTIDTRGVLEWLGGLSWGYQKRYWQTLNPKTYSLSYCRQGGCDTPCFPRPGQAGPEFVALLLVFEGMDW